MLNRWEITIYCSAILCVVALLVGSTVGRNAETPQGQLQVVDNVDKILNANLPAEGENIQMIKVAEDDSATLFIARIAQGSEVRPHFHKTHSETVCVIKGVGRLLIGGEWVEVKPNTLHFNSQGQIHSLQNAGNGDLVILSIFTPALKEPDRNFLP